MKLLTIIPARAGSKGIKEKNIINFLGKPLIFYTINFAKKIKKGNIIVSTDSKKIKKICDKFLKTYNYIRPSTVSKDSTPLSDTIIHLVKWAIKKNIFFDYILILQPTSPYRNKKDLFKMIKLLKRKNFNSLCSVVKVKNHPSEYVKKKDGKWKFLIKNNPGIRQKYDQNYYFIDGSYYFVKKEYFLKNKKIISNDNCFFPLKYEYGIDIDENIDLKVSETLFKYYNGNS
tara:strand:- start:184 stop:873 length:690 start_codon:yes stop_codon:yes gene_type:complete